MGCGLNVCLCSVVVHVLLFAKCSMTNAEYSILQSADVLTITSPCTLLMTYFVNRKPIMILACLSSLLPLLTPIKSNQNLERYVLVVIL